jgi:hypothetical protein
MQRISSAIDADGGIERDAELRALLDRDPDALLYAQDLVRIDEVLADLGRRAAEPDWDALSAHIEAGLDREESGEPLEGFDAPPRFLDADPRDASVSQEVVVAPVASAPRPQPEAKVVDLASRRRSTVFAWTGGLAAAAAVGLGIAFGTTSLGTTFDAAPSSEPAAAYEQAEAEAAPVAQAVAPPPPAMPAPAGAAAWDGRAEAEASPEPLPAAAVAVGRARGSAGGGGAAAPMAAPMRLAEPAAREPAAEATGVIAQPGRAQVLTTLHDVEPSVQRCLARVGEVARVTLQVGVAGNVVSTRVDPPYTGADAACIVDALRGARLPPSPEGYVFVHAFRPAPVAGGSLARPPNASRAARRRPVSPAQRAESAREAEVTDALE